MASHLTIRMTVKPNTKAQVISWFAEMFKGTRTYSGFQSIDLFAVEGAEDDLMLIQKWDDRSSFERYLAWRNETGHGAKLAELLVGPMQITFLQETGA